MLSLARRPAASTTARRAPAGEQAFATSAGRRAEGSHAAQVRLRKLEAAASSGASKTSVPEVDKASAIMAVRLSKFQFAAPPSPAAQRPTFSVATPATLTGVLQYAYPENKTAGAESARSARAAALKSELRLPPAVHVNVSASAAKSVKPPARVRRTKVELLQGPAKKPVFLKAPATKPSLLIGPAVSFVHLIEPPSPQPSLKAVRKARHKTLIKAQRLAELELKATEDADLSATTGSEEEVAAVNENRPVASDEGSSTTSLSAGRSRRKLAMVKSASKLTPVEPATHSAARPQAELHFSPQWARVKMSAPHRSRASDGNSALSPATLEQRSRSKSSGGVVQGQHIVRPFNAAKESRPLRASDRLGLEKAKDMQTLWSGRVDGTQAHKDLEVVKPETERPPVARLAHSLDRALFNPGVHLMRDPQTDVFNFDERLRILPHPDEIDLKRFPAYVTASKDTDLAQLAEEHKCRFFGSTSTLTSSLAQIWFLISGWKRLDLTSLTGDWQTQPATFTYGTKGPAAIHLRYDAARDMYGVDNDKSSQPPGQQRILSNLGKVMEKMLTTSVEDLDRFRKSASAEGVTQEERTAREAYNYTKGRSLLMRSQLDGHDERLPGSGIFDVKTRATASVRFDIENHEEGQHYQLSSLTGLGPSFERERYDMMRSAYLKYGLQCRIGGMDGIFCAYHSTRYLQGFEYIPLETMDKVVYGSAGTGDRSFGLSVNLLERIFEHATDIYPKESLNIIMQTIERPAGEMVVVVQPMRDDLPANKMPTVELRVNVQSTIRGSPIERKLPNLSDSDSWNIEATIRRCPEEASAAARKTLRLLKNEAGVLAKSGKPLPTGKTQEEMQKLFRQRWEAEVNDAEGEFASFAWRRATLREAQAALEAKRLKAKAAGKPSSVAHKVAYPLPLVRASPPHVVFPPPGKSVLALRELSRHSKTKEEALEASRQGRPVVYLLPQSTTQPASSSP